jgi:hypothetical protein
MFPVMNNLEMNRAKKKLKKPHFRGGFHAVLETLCTNILSIFKFVKVLNHFQVQVF